eukprot:27347_1
MLNNLNKKVCIKTIIIENCHEQISTELNLFQFIKRFNQLGWVLSNKQLNENTEQIIISQKQKHAQKMSKVWSKRPEYCNDNQQINIESIQISIRYGTPTYFIYVNNKQTHAQIKRYSEFRKFYDQINKAISQTTTMKDVKKLFPSKEIFNKNTHPNVMYQRKKLFNLYFAALIKFANDNDKHTKFIINHHLQYFIYDIDTNIDNTKSNVTQMTHHRTNLSVTYNDEIDSMLRHTRQKDMKIKKMLFLGTECSGKSTFFKQLIAMFQGGWSDNALKDYIEQIECQIISQMKKLIFVTKQCIEEKVNDVDDLNLKIKSLESIKYVKFLENNAEINDEVAYHINNLWSDDAIKYGFQFRAQYLIPDSCSHFFDRINIICNDDYLPTIEDMLLIRKATTGIIEKQFILNGTIYHAFDVGGQRNERKKWIHCFENVTVVIFVASLSAYDECISDDKTVNSMHESLQVFEEMVNSRWFRYNSFILFLNKRDIFTEKILSKPIIECFPKYKGPLNDFDSNYNFIKREYEMKNLNPKEKHVYTHCTCATDRDNARQVFNDVEQIVIQNSLHKGGLI